MNAYAIARFWSKADVRRPGECWEWNAARNEHGYGIFRMPDERRNVRAHRMAWELTHGERLPADVKLLHRCDNPPCVNPNHLERGTQLDNIADMVAKGRVARGAQKPNSKLSPEDVAKMRLLRAQGETQKALADRFGVAQSRVSVLTRKDS